MVSGAWDVETDVLVVGSGGGALTAAITAADRHAKVTVIEKSEFYGGTTANSGGVIWIPASKAALAEGHQDSPEDAFQYIKALAGEEVADSRIRSFIQNAPEMLDYMQKNSEIRFFPIPYTDYHAELPGGKLGYRSHDPVPIQAQELGKEFDYLRSTHPTAMLFGRISWTAGEGALLITRAPGWFKALTKVLWRYYTDLPYRLSSNRSRFITGGMAIIARLKVSLDKRGIPIWRNTRLTDLIVEDGRVVGAVAEREGRTIRIRAAKGVILAAGGFERSQELRAANIPQSPNAEWSGSQRNNTGDALVAARKVGAATERLDAGWWAPTVKVPTEDFSRPLFFERSLPGCLIIDQTGHRFTNEAASYHIVGQEMMKAYRPELKHQPFYILFDAAFRKRYPMGPVMPVFPDWTLPAAVRKILIKVNSWDEMAQRLGLPAEVLKETIRRFNANAKEGKDPDFGRGHHAYDRYYGDPRVQPNPNLLPLETGPFYALAINPGDIGTSGGLRTDENARVLTESGEPIPGLYACGNTAASVMGRAYPGAGSTIGPAMTFGFVAARHITGANE